MTLSAAQLNAQAAGRHNTKPPDARLRPYKGAPIKSVRLEIRPAQGCYPTMWWKVIDDGDGVPATDAEVWLWIRWKQAEARA